jgi:hypothetical protein
MHIERHYVISGFFLRKELHAVVRIGQTSKFNIFSIRFPYLSLYGGFYR